MFSSRMFTILALFFGAFALFASAGPIGAPTDVVAPRGLHDNELVPRGGQCNSPGMYQEPQSSPSSSSLVCSSVNEYFV